MINEDFDKKIWGEDFSLVPAIIRKRAFRAHLNKDLKLIDKIVSEFFFFNMHRSYERIAMQQN